MFVRTKHFWRFVTWKWGGSVCPLSNVKRRWLEDGKWASTPSHSPKSEGRRNKQDTDTPIIYLFIMGRSHVVSDAWSITSKLLLSSTCLPLLTWLSRCHFHNCKTIFYYEYFRMLTFNKNYVVIISILLYVAIFL